MICVNVHIPNFLVLTALDEKFSNLEDNETELLTTIEKLQNRTSELESQLSKLMC